MSERHRLHAGTNQHSQLRFLEWQLHLRDRRRQRFAVLQRQPRQAISDSLYQTSAGRGRRKTHPLWQPLESTGIHEGQQRYASWWQIETGVLSILGQLLHEVHLGISERRHTRLGHYDSKRTHGDTNMGVMYLLRGRRERLFEKLSRPDDEKGG